MVDPETLKKLPLVDESILEQLKRKDTVKEVVSTFTKLSTACQEAQKPDIYEVAKEFFADVIGIKIDQCDENEKTSESLESLMSVDLMNRFRHKTVYEKYSSECEIDIIPKTVEQQEFLKNLVSSVIYFSGLDVVGQQTIVDALGGESFKAGDVILAKGAALQKFYMVDSGFFKSFMNIPGTNLRMLKNAYYRGDYFAQEALMRGERRMSRLTIEAVTDGKLWSIHHKVFEGIEYKSQQTRRNKFENLIKTVPLLKELDSDDKLKLSDTFEVRLYEIDDIIIREDETPDGMYFIEEGSVVCEVFDEEQLQFVEIYRIYTGDFFGEVGLIEGHLKNMYRITALETCITAYLNADAYHRILETNITPALKASVVTFMSKMNIVLGKSALQLPTV